MPAIESFYFALSDLAALPLFIWIAKGVLLLATILLLHVLLEPRRAAMRHASISAGILMLMLIPLLSTVLPSWHLPVFDQQAALSTMPTTQEGTSQSATAGPVATDQGTTAFPALRPEPGQIDTCPGQVVVDLSMGGVLGSGKHHSRYPFCHCSDLCPGLATVFVTDP